MEWYNNMSERQKRGFQKIIFVSAMGIFLVLLVPLICMGGENEGFEAT